MSQQSRSLMGRLAAATALAATLVMSAPAQAADVGVSISVNQPGFYGRVDIGDQRPVLIYPQPIVIHQGAYTTYQRPIYMRVPRRVTTSNGRATAVSTTPATSRCTSSMAGALTPTPMPPPRGVTTTAWTDAMIDVTTVGTTDVIATMTAATPARAKTKTGAMATARATATVEA